MIFLVAIIKLKENVPNYRGKYRLGNIKDEEVKKLRALGWGNESKLILNDVDLRLIRPNLCEKILNRIGHTKKESELCAGSIDGNRGIYFIIYKLRYM